MADQNRTRRFEETILAHLDSAYGFARWLTRNDADAQDITQEAMLRAFRFFEAFRGDNPKAWLLAIVRNTTMTWLQRNRPVEIVASFDDESARLPDPGNEASAAPDPERALLLRADGDRLNRLIAALPTPFREALILRELEELSYREIADVTSVPVGTVMSRLSRARALLLRAWDDEETRKTANGRS